MSDRATATLTVRITAPFEVAAAWAAKFLAEGAVDSTKMLAESCPYDLQPEDFEIDTETIAAGPKTFLSEDRCPHAIIEPGVPGIWGCTKTAGHEHSHVTTLGYEF